MKSSIFKLGGTTLLLHFGTFLRKFRKKRVEKNQQKRISFTLYVIPYKAGLFLAFDKKN